jgi:hypothetical protein
MGNIAEIMDILQGHSYLIDKLVDIQYNNAVKKQNNKMTELQISEKPKNVVTSLELVKEINMFREQEGNRSEIVHSDLLKIIRDEFEEEIGLGNISPSSYLNSQNKEQPMFNLTPSQAKQVLVRESKFVRKGVIAKLEKLENNQMPISIEDALIQQLQFTKAIRLEQEAIKAEQGQINNRLDLVEAKQKTRPEYFTVAGYGSLLKIPVNLTLAIKLGKDATKICTDTNTPIDKVHDPRFGLVGSYPVPVLKEVFRKQFA